MRAKTKIFLVLIVLLAAFFRFWDLKHVPPGLYPDEAMNGSNALEAIATKEWKVFYPDNNGREGLFINIQSAFIYFLGASPWALRLPSAVFGTLTVLGLYLLAEILFRSKSQTETRDLEFGISRGEFIGLLSSFFLATSFWHLNFSRIGFRAIMAPFFLVWGLYFFFRFYKDTGSNASQTLSAAFGGLLFGLGFHSYIAYRIAPLLLVVPLLAKSKFPARPAGGQNPNSKSCFSCICALFLFFAFIAALPLGLYFFQNPEDFFGRTAQISVFNDPSPLAAFLANFVKTVGMFWIYGDANWRHNFSGAPELSVLVGILFLAGLIFSVKNLVVKKHGGEAEKFNGAFLLSWLALMLLPVAISSEGLPHALRAVIVIPPVIILAALGFDTILTKAQTRLDSKKQSRRAAFFISLLLVAVALGTFNKYFNKWAPRPEVYDAFSARDWNLALWLKALPDEVEKYIIIRGERIDAKTITISSQSVLFGTETVLTAERDRKKFHYLSPEELQDKLALAPQKAVIAFLKSENKEFVASLLKKHPDLKVKVPGDFIVLETAP
ncbi:hypothetical protein HY406_00175 [Candidatus Giovannonibacteria bacterium]|nr:hypothetical protein [Candidatus Giovannonibacteria bacterium]